MADYHPLIARAVAGLERNTGENRRALYERARIALVGQLRSISPALNESDITRERLALEDAIRRVEGDVARRARGDLPDEGREAGERDEIHVPPQMPPRTAPLRPAGPSLSDQGLKGFRQTVAGAEGLGAAAAPASKTARGAYNAVPEEERRAPYLRREPSFGEGPAHTERPRFEPPNVEPENLESPQFEPPHAEPAPPSFDEGSYDQPPYPDHAPHDRDATLPPDTLEADNMAEPLPDARPESEAFRASLPDAETWPPARPGASPPRHDDNDYEGPRRSYRGLIRGLVIFLLIAGVAAAVYWKREPIGTMVAAMRSSLPAPTAPRDATAARPKITDRVGANDQPRSATAPAADVAQKVVLYDEDPNDPQGKRYVGSAVWRTETVSPGPGLAPELVVRADIDIPERRMKMSWSLRRNTDKTLPASHTIEILFTLPADFPEGGITNVPGVLMKQSEQTRGVPLAGLAVKVTNGFFLIGLSAVDVDMQRNIELLKQRSWFDLPIVYNNGKRAILAVEKGTPGDQVFEEAFRAWGQ
jgi:hypothetical protein